MSWVSKKVSSSPSEKSDVSSANILRIYSVPLGKSLIQIKNRIGSNAEPSGIPASIFFREKVLPFVDDLLSSF